MLSLGFVVKASWYKAVLNSVIEAIKEPVPKTSGSGMVTWEMFGKNAVDTINSTGKAHLSLAESDWRSLLPDVPTMTVPFSMTSASFPATSLFLYSTWLVFSWNDNFIFFDNWNHSFPVKITVCYCKRDCKLPQSLQKVSLWWYFELILLYK